MDGMENDGKDGRTDGRRDEWMDGWMDERYLHTLGSFGALELGFYCFEFA